MSRTHFLIVLIFVMVAAARLFTPGFYTSHDGGNHLVRIYHFYYLLLHGQPIPRWDDYLNFNLGYPIFNFMNPLPYYLTSVFMFLAFSVINAFKAVVLICTLLGSVFFYFWSFRAFHSRPASLTASLLYLFTPYRFLDMYVRADLGELVITAVLPLAFYAVEAQKPRLLAAALALFPLAHPPLAVVFFPLVIIYAFIRRLQVRTLLTAVILGLTLSAFFWLPAIFLKSSVRLSFSPRYTADHLLAFRQIVYSPWGFGFSPNGVSFQLGIVNWLVLLAVSLLAFRGPGIIRFFATAVWAAIVLSTRFSQPVWAFPPLLVLQFPWRLLSVPLLAVPFLAAYFVSRFRRFPAILLSGLLVLAVYSNRNHIRTNLPQFTGVTDAYFFRTDTTTTVTPDELMPRVMNSQTRYHFTSSPLITASEFTSLAALIFLIISLWHSRFRSA